MFNDKKHALLDVPAERQVKKQYHFTVTPIEDIEKYRADKKLREIQQAAERKARFNDVLNRLQAAMDTGAPIVQTQEVIEKVKAVEAQSGKIEQTMRRFENAEISKTIHTQPADAPLIRPAEPVPKLPWYERVMNAVYETFIKLPFNQ